MSADQVFQALSWVGTVSQQVSVEVDLTRGRMGKSRWLHALCSCRHARHVEGDLSTDSFSPLIEYASSEGVCGSVSPLGYPAGGTALFVNDQYLPAAVTC